MKQTLLIITGLIFFVFLFTFPAVFHISDKIIGDGGDNYQFLAFQYIANKQIVSGQLPFGWTNYWRFPVGFDFSTSYDSALFLLAGILFYQIISNPVVIYNLSVLLFLFLNGLFSYLFFEKATNSKMLGFIGGLIYGFSFYNLARLGGHPNLILTGCFPLFFYALQVFYDRKADRKSFILLTFSIILVFLVSLQYVLILFGILLFLIPLGLLFYRDTVKSLLGLFVQKKEYSIYSTVTILAVFLLFNSAKVFSFFNQSFILPTAEIVSVPIINYILPNTYLKIIPAFMANGTKEWIEYAVFLGFFEVILFIFFLIFDCLDRKLKIFFLVNVVVFFIIVLGDMNNSSLPLPYPQLFKFLPFRGIIEAARFYVFLYLILTLAILSFLKKFLQETGKVGFSLVLLFLIFERIPTNFYLSDTLSDEVFIKEVSSSNTKAVFDLPIFTDWWNGNKYDLYSVYYKKPIVNGYIHWSGNTKDSQFFLNKLKRFECSMDKNFEPKNLDENEIIAAIDQNRKLLQDLKGYEITILVFHKDISIKEKQCLEAVEHISILLEKSGTEFSKLYEDEDKVVYQLEN